MYFNLKAIALKAVVFLTATSILTSCGTNSSSNDSGPANNAGDQPSGPTRDNTPNSDDHNPAPKVCQSGKVLKILDNGHHVMSSLVGAKKNTALWDSENGKLDKEIESLSRFHSVSVNGKFILRKISSQKYQLISGVNQARPIIRFNTNGYIPTFYFSKDERYLVAKYRPAYNFAKDQITVYDLKTNHFLVRSIIEKKILASSITNDSKYLLVVKRERYSNYIQIYNFSVLTNTGKLKIERTIKLPTYESFNKMIVGNGIIAIKTASNNLFYDFLSGEELYTNRKLHIFDVDQEGDYALVSDNWEELKVMNLQTGIIEITEKKPAQLLVSTCQLRSAPFRVLCKDSSNQGKVLLWNLEEKLISRTCY